MDNGFIDYGKIEREARALRAQEMRRLVGVMKRRLFGKRDRSAPEGVGAH